MRNETRIDSPIANAGLSPVSRQPRLVRISALSAATGVGVPVASGGGDAVAVGVALGNDVAVGIGPAATTKLHDVRVVCIHGPSALRSSRSTPVGGATRARNER